MEESSVINATTASSLKPQSATSNNTTSQPSSSGSWWSGWVDKVKQSSETIIKIYKEDIKEFTKTIQEDTKQVVKKATEEKEVEKITSQISSGITGLFSFGSKKEESNQVTNQPKQVVVDRHQARILALQTELSTYCTEPSDLEDFNNWKKTFRVSLITEEISQLLAVNEKIREIHTKLVPVAVSYTDFWERYFYKLHKLNQEEERRAALVKRATNERNDDEELKWDEEDESEEPKSVAPKHEVEKYLETLDSPHETTQKVVEDSAENSTAEQASEPVVEVPKSTPKVEIDNQMEKKEASEENKNENKKEEEWEWE